MLTKADPCIMIIFGASGDLTKRLLLPAIYNLGCDGLLPERFAIVGFSMDDYTTESFREKLNQDLGEFGTRETPDPIVREWLIDRLHYVAGRFDDPVACERVVERVQALDRELDTAGNVLLYLATPPPVFPTIARHMKQAGVRQLGNGWQRVVVEKPFGTDLSSARELNRELLGTWDENQIYGIDHYLGKETVQNLLAFRFTNGIFEPVWNKKSIDHIQLTVAEQVGVEGRGDYYENAGVLRDMIQNHMLQMLAYVCMEPPVSLGDDSVRDEKAKLLRAVRLMAPADVSRCTVRGQYGAGRTSRAAEVAGYRDEPGVRPDSNTETFAAMKLFVDNPRWEGVPFYLRSGKRLWKKETTIAVRFKKAPQAILKGLSTTAIDSNYLIFHIQPEQSIELRFQAKVPGPQFDLQRVNMLFEYGEAFEASRGTGYETLLFSCMTGDTTPFSRSDLVETAWEIAQPVLDAWASEEADDFPNYSAGSWGPRKAFEMIEGDGRRWVEVIGRDIIEGVPLFEGCSRVFLNSLSMALRPKAFSAGEHIVRAGTRGHEMYFINRGSVEVIGTDGQILDTLDEGDFFGEIALLLSQDRTASVRAVTDCDLLVLDRSDLSRAVRDHPHFANSIREVARKRYEMAEARISPET